MNNKPRCVEIARYMLIRGTTVREAAAAFGIGKSTAHKDLTERLPYVDPYLSTRVEKLLALNKAERHIRGGEATKRKFSR